MATDVDALYEEHLSEADRRIIEEATGLGPPFARALGRPELEVAVFGADLGDHTLAAMSPFLAFAVAVHRTAAHLEGASFVEERFSARLRIPVFDVEPLRELLGTPERRFFLVELLASYTHVSSGATWQRTRRGWRRRRFSELDPVRLAELVELADELDRPGIYRRLGDLALFLTGVFPDHEAAFDFGPRAPRLARVAGLAPTAADEEETGAALLERVGARAYRAAVASVERLGLPVTGSLAVVADMAERFATARRVLNVVTDRYLFPIRGQWFGAG
ncbi:MAG TPA: hypothetical protein VKV23_02335 [Acidimicrobiales bacterium]|nr:hypothetical protein [Acidimicrobiales bacterium]